MSRVLFLSLLLVSAIAGPAPPAAPYDTALRQRSTQAALAPVIAAQPHPLHNNSYIIMLNHGIDKSLMDNHFNFLQSVHAEDSSPSDVNSGVSQVYDGHVKGYAGRFTEGTISRIRTMPEVLYVEKDQVSNHSFIS